MKVNTQSSLFKLNQIHHLEDKYNAKYVLESSIRIKDGSWGNFPAAIFYTKEPHPTGSNYFALYYEYNMDGTMSLFIADGISAIKDVTFCGLEAEGEVIYSRFRHDFRSHKNGAFVDGGRSYFRFGGDNYDDYNVVRFQIVDGEIEFIPDPIVPDVDYHYREYDR